MEGRPPPFDPDDDLDFDFDASRRRRAERIERGETGERPAQPRRSDTDEDPYEGAEERRDDDLYGEDESDSDSDAFDTTGERPARARRERPKRGGFSIPPIGRKRRAAKRERAAAADSPDTGERPYESTETPFESTEAPYESTETPYESTETAYPSTGTVERAADDPFAPVETAAERRARRNRHADLPAKVRRRQAIAVGAIALLVIGGGYVLLSGGGGGGDEEEPLAAKKLVGQTMVGVMLGDGVTPQLLKAVRKGRLGSVFIKAGVSEATVQQAVPQLQQAAAEGDNPPLLVMIDQEGGEIKPLPGAPDTSPADLGRSGDSETARTEGQKTGQYLKPFGINIDLAPVLDVELPQTAETIGSRTFGDDPNRVADLGSAFIDGIQSQQVAATAKHFPGLGPATINTDFAAVSVRATDEQFQEALVPFQAAVDAGVKLVMVSSAAYPNYAGATPGAGKVKPAAFATPIVQGMLREQLGFTGVVITDDLESIAIKELTTRDAAAIAALRAGCDLALYARTLDGASAGLTAVVKAMKQGKLDRAVVQQAYDRVQDLKESLPSG